MLDQIDNIARRYDALESQMADPAVTADYTKLTELAQERAEMEPIVTAYRRYQTLAQELEETEEMLELEEGAEMRALANEEIDRLSAELDSLQQQMRRLLVPKDPRDKRNVYLEIRAGTGGDEAAIFAADLMRMYTRFAERHGYQVAIVDENWIGAGGYKEVIANIRGNGAYSKLKFESGVHRVQRVPVTESQGRIHTSAATVAVIPELDEVDITLDDNDLEIKAEFSAGPGGQHMQKNATAARIIHKPTGIMVKIQSERSLTQNKQVGKAIIQARIQEMEEAKQHAAIAADRKAQVGSGDRSEKIRTYNYPQSRVTDHRIGLSSYNLSAVMDGDLDQFVDALTVADEAAKMAALEQ
ncbi:MAG: peptide chain release factor 1 [Anaerolineae bacterium]|nr:peptide chain release factor 1 [Anaerolineae bacterium]MCO5187695.1 peptide chain release factor 1 [Anaerolineae bacterium]MCO5197912.1 peptide chain release factor 1 [Anaerolineae bacterium]